MKTKVIYKNFELIFVLILVILHIIYRSYQIAFINSIIILKVFL